MEWLIVLLLKYKYLIMFWLMFIEGPVVSFICAFLAAQGVFSFGIVYMFSILGDLTGDIVWYGLGRFARRFGAKKYLDMHHRWEAIDKESLKWTARISVRVASKIHHLEQQSMFQYISRQTKKRFFLALALVKITPPLSIPGQISFGFLKIPFHKFVLQTVLLIVIFESVFLNLGYFSSMSINTFKDNVDTIGYIISAIVIGWIALWISILIMKKLRAASKSA